MFGYEGPSYQVDLMPRSVGEWSDVVGWWLLGTMIQCSHHLSISLVHWQRFASISLSCTEFLLRLLHCSLECTMDLETNMQRIPSSRALIPTPHQLLSMDLQFPLHACKYGRDKKHGSLIWLACMEIWLRKKTLFMKSIPGFIKIQWKGKDFIIFLWNLIMDHFFLYGSLGCRSIFVINSWLTMRIWENICSNASSSLQQLL